MDRKPDKSDRDRLKQIEQSDLSESRVNQDFVDWLKTKGPNYLLVILAALCVYMLIVRWNQSKLQTNVEAWEALSTADMPRSKEDVADEYADVAGIADLAQITAARQYLASVRANATIESMAQQAAARATIQQPTPNAPILTVPLTVEQRDQNLAEATRLFQTVLDRLATVNSKSEPGRILLKTAAIEGLAAAAESIGDVQEAKQLYEQAAATAEIAYPKLAQQARTRADNVDALATVTSLPTIGEVGQNALVPTFESAPQTTPMLQSLERLIVSEESTTTASAPSES